MIIFAKQLIFLCLFQVTIATLAFAAIVEGFRFRTRKGTGTSGKYYYYGPGSKYNHGPEPTATVAPDYYVRVADLLTLAHSSLNLVGR